MTHFVPTHIPVALDAITTEHDRIVAERDAFATFQAALTELSPPDATSAHGRGRSAAQLAVPPPADPHLQEVRRAYQETVMNVPHYTEEYDESLAKNLAMELDPEVATAVIDGESLSAPLYERLCIETQHAYTQRLVILQGIVNERADVAAVHEHIQQLQPGVDDLLETPVQTVAGPALADARTTTLEFERQCDQLAADRQATLRTTRAPGPRREPLPLAEYLYQPLAVTYPVLADLAEMADTVRTIRHRIERNHHPTDREPAQHADSSQSTG